MRSKFVLMLLLFMLLPCSTDASARCKGSYGLFGRRRPPVVSALSPADNAVNVSLDNDLTISFNKVIYYVGSGNVVLRKSDNSVVEIIPANSQSIKVSGATVTISHKPFEANTSYYVTIASNCFYDYYGNAYGGINNTTSWNFSTIAAPPPPPPPPPPPVVKGLNVILIGPSPGAVRDLTPDQVAILTSRTVRDWMEVSCEKAEDGLPAFRLISRVDITPDMPARWKSLIALAPTEGCSVVATKPVPDSPDATLVAPLPEDSNALLKMLADFAGVSAVPPNLTKKANPPIFTDEQWKQFNPQNKVAIFDGKQRFLSLKPRDLKKHPYGTAPGSVSLLAAGIRLIPREEWPKRLEALKKANAGIMPLVYGKVECHDQGSTNYCWANCVVGAAGYLKYTQGQAPYILSAASVGGPITGYRNVGGWPADAVVFMQKTGAVRTNFWPNTAINSSYASKPECIADYPKHKVAEIIADLGASGKIFDETVTCVLLGCPVAVSYNWWSHAVVAVGLDYQNGKWYLILRNSWGADYGDNGFFKLPEGSGSNKGTPDDAQALLYMSFQ